MTPERWAHLKAIFGQLLDVPPRRRPALLQRLCAGDSELERILAGLVANHEEAGETPAPKPDSTPLIGPGALLGERFRVEKRLGSGGFGDVFRVLDMQRNARVALKVLRSLDPGAVFRFKREFRTLASVRHVNIVQLYELLNFESYWMYTMELVEGHSWLEFVRTPGPAADFVEPNLREALSQLVSGIAALHRHGLLHRDIKPSNAMVDTEGRVVLLDFGLVRDAAAEQSRTVAGTPEYMSPEQALGQTVTPASDWYSVGVLLYQALTGALPHKGSLLNLIYGKQNEVPVAPAVLHPAAPRDLSALCMALLEADPARRPSEQQILDVLHATIESAVRADESSEFHGRQTELAELAQYLRQSRAGVPVAVQLVGPSGIGKSSLIAQFFRQAARQHPRTVFLLGRCFASESVPYQGIDDLVDDLTNQLVRLPHEERVGFFPDRFEELARIFPALGRLADVRAPRIADAVEIRRRAFRALREMLARIAERRGLVAAIDDLQWADADSAAVLRELLDPGEGLAGMFVLAYRPEALSDGGMVSEILANLANPGEIVLRPFSRDEARDFAVRLGPGLERSSLTALADESGGDPFLLRQAVQYYKAASDPGVTLDGLLQRRIGDLPERDRLLLEAVAVSGRPPEVEVLSAMAASPEETLASISDLAARRFLRRRGGVRQLVDVYHDRIRSAVLGSLGAKQIQDHHLALAAALEAARPDDADRLAFHYERAGAGAKAVRHVLNAAARAAAALAFDRAAQLFRLVLGLEGTDTEQRYRAFRGLGDALSNRGHGPEAAQCLLEAAAIGPADERLRLRAEAANQLLRSGHFASGERAPQRGSAGSGPARAVGRERGCCWRSGPSVWLRNWVRLRFGKPRRRPRRSY